MIAAVHFDGSRNATGHDGASHAACHPMFAAGGATGEDQGKHYQGFHYTSLSKWNRILCRAADGVAGSFS
jgi:hypothetical protein